MSRKPGALGLLFAIGAFLVATGLVDIYQDWALEGNRPWTTLAENLFPLLIAGGIMALGWRWSQVEEGEVYVTEAARWVLASGVGMAFLSAIVLGFQIGQGRLKPIVIVTQMATFGAGAGLIIGYVVAQIRETRRKLRHHRDLLQRTQEVASVGGWEYDPGADRVDGTVELNRILGLPEEESFDLERAFRFYPADKRDTVRKNVDKCLQDGEPFDLEMPLTRDDGSRIWSRVRGQRKRHEEGRVFLTGTLQDITKQKEVEHVLREEQEVLRRMYHITADRDTAFDAKLKKLIDLGRSYLDLSYGYLTRISEGTQEITHATGEHPQLRPGERFPLSKSYCQKTVEEGLLAIQNAPEEGWKGHPVFERFGVDAYIGSKVEVGGDLYGTFCFAADEARPEPFAEREKTFVELLTLWASYEIGRDRTTRRLKAQNERLEQFSSVLTHDLRNPLNVAQGRLALALEEVDGPERSGSDGKAGMLPDHLRSASGALGRMERLIDDVLALTWSEQGFGPEEMEDAGLQKMARGCWEQVEAPEATLQVETGLTVQAHAGRLQQLLENLFRNAVEHAGESVTIAVGPLQEVATSEGAPSEEEAPKGFFVEDDGPGIPEEKRDKIFERGYSSEEDGTGLGLSIALAIAEAHEWAISVTEGKEGGARFTVTGVEEAGTPREEPERF